MRARHARWSAFGNALPLVAAGTAVAVDLAVAHLIPGIFPEAGNLLLPLSLLTVVLCAYRFGMWAGVGAAVLACFLSATLKNELDLSLVAMQAIAGGAVGRIRQQADLRDRRFAALTENSTDLVLVINARGSATYVSQSFQAVLGHAPQTLMGTGYRILFRGQSSEALAAALDDAYTGVRKPRRYEFHVNHADGSAAVIDASITNSLADPSVAGVVLNAQNVTESHRAQVQLVRQATHDALTGLPNRTLLNDLLTEDLVAAEADDRQIGLLLVDLDRFKDVNEALGHQSGDALLCEVAERLRRYVPEGGLVARLGGDEFAVVMRETDIEAATSYAHRLIGVLSRPFALPAQTLVISASLGIAVSEPGATAPGLLRQADVAIHAAKRRRSGVAVFSSSHDERALKRLEMSSDLPSAIASGQLVLHYQPQMDVRSGLVRAAEALVRWEHPDRGLIAPDLFLPLAEEIGLMNRLTEWVLDAAISQIRTWNSIGLRIRLSVNLSAEDLRDGTLSATISRLLSKYEVSAEQLCLELTETTLTTEAERAAECLRTLAKSGIRISIDDFGTGYSSLSHLKQFTVDELKIDKQFVMGMQEDADDAAIVRSTIELAHRLGIDVVVEGVENDETYGDIRRMRAECAQGYLIGRPMPAPTFEAWMLANRRAPSAASA
jgi:diguanylate cyclase (GGDEF)-like protein/PAS domain S-box-containing protein